MEEIKSKITFSEGPHFNVDFQTYLNAEGVGKSTLFAFGEAATPLHFKAQPPKVQTADMAFGSVCHAAVLTPDLFAGVFHLRPEQYPAEVRGKEEMKPWHGGATWCKDWLACHADKPVMTREDLVHVAAIRKTLTTSPKLEEFRGALAHGQTEVSWFKRDEETGLLLKARTDLICTDTSGRTHVYDLKKVQVGEARHDAFSKQAYSLGYHVQMASYLSITGASKFNFIPFDDGPPYDACQWEPDADFYAHGLRDWRRLLNAYAACVKSGEWPGYVGGKLSLPKWAKERIE